MAAQRLARDLHRDRKDLTKAIELNSRYAAAYAWLGETKAFLGTGESVGLIRRAITIEPMEASHRLRLAGVLLRQGKPAEAGVEAQAALTLADIDEERREAERLVETAAKAVAAAASRPATAPAATSPSAAPSSSGASPPAAMDVGALNKACQSGDNGACGQILPAVEAACAKKNGPACGFAGFLYERGRGVTADPGRAAGFYQQSCDAGDRMGCMGFAMLQARGNGVAKDSAKAQATLSQLCTDGVLEACTQLAILVVPGGTPADLARGRELLTKACDGKHERACELLKSMPKASPK